MQERANIEPMARRMRRYGSIPREPETLHPARTPGYSDGCPMAFPRARTRKQDHPNRKEPVACALQAPGHNRQCSALSTRNRNTSVPDGRAHSL